MKLLNLSIIALLLGGCATGVTVGDRGARGPVSGSAAGGNTVGASTQLQRCTAPLGTLAVVEDTSQDWYLALTTQYQLPATTPLLRLLIQQPNCFVIVDRGRAMKLMQAERDMARNEDLRGNSNMGGGQMVAADYTVTPFIQFAQATGGGAVGAITGFFSPIAGAVAGGMRKVEAATTLILVDGRSGVQVAISEGVAAKKDFSFGAIAGGNGGVVGMGAWQDTLQGKVIAGAFLYAFNQMTIAARDYSGQRTGPNGLGTGPNGLGTGGALGVDGARTAPVSAPTAVLMPVRQAQIRLAELNFYSGAIDGVAGAGMAKALSDFQRAKALSVTGQLDMASFAALAR